VAVIATLSRLDSPHLENAVPLLLWPTRSPEESSTVSMLSCTTRRICRCRCGYAGRAAQRRAFGTCWWTRHPVCNRRPRVGPRRFARLIDDALDAACAAARFLRPTIVVERGRAISARWRHPLSGRLGEVATRRAYGRRGATCRCRSTSIPGDCSQRRASAYHHSMSSTYNMVGRPLLVAVEDGRTCRQWLPSICARRVRSRPSRRC
jgi:hypothetical protein